jgi:hypothetical protein
MEGTMSGNKAMRRAVETKDVYRIGTDVPLLTDETVFVEPLQAKDMLTRNNHNRPVNWRKAEEYSRIIKAGHWKLHSQGIILDEKGEIITGQTRLWAVVLADQGAWLRISRGNRQDVAHLIDRGRPQTARDLATRKTQQKHSPVEASIARAICVLDGVLRPTPDEIAATIVVYTDKLRLLILKTAGTKKTKAVQMILGAICIQAKDTEELVRMAINTAVFAEELDHKLLPQSASSCWNKGAAFSLAMEKARAVVSSRGRAL